MKLPFRRSSVARTRKGIKQGNATGNYEKMTGHLEDGRSTAARSTGINPGRRSRSTRGCRTCRLVADGPVAELQPSKDAERVEHAAVPTIAFALRRRERATRALGAARRPAADRGAPPAVRRRRARAAVRAVRAGRAVGHALRTLLWTRATLVVPPFTGATVVELPVACSYDLEVAASRYFDALEDGEVPLEFLFSAAPSSTGAAPGRRGSRGRARRRIGCRSPCGGRPWTATSAGRPGCGCRSRASTASPRTSPATRWPRGRTSSTRCSGALMDPVRQIADAVLYEGYLLWPYRRSALKNQLDVRLGRPRSRREAADARAVPARGRRSGRGGGDRALPPDGRGRGRRARGSTRAGVPAARRRADGGGGDAGSRPACTRLTVELVCRDGAVSAPRSHAMLRTAHGGFVSLTDPPERRFVAAAEACDNVGVWPILVGEPGSADTMLCSPIILEDHPRIAPESPGDLFDGGEIDGLLDLNILEPDRRGEGRDARQRPAGAGDPRAHRVAAPEELMRLHGFRVAGNPAGDPCAEWETHERYWEELERPAPDAVVVDGVELRRGSRVRLRRARAATCSTSCWPARSRSSRGSTRTSTAPCTSRSRSRTTRARPRRARQPGHRFFFSRRRSSRSPAAGAATSACWWRASATCSWATTASGSRWPGGWRAASRGRASRSSTSGSAAWTSRTRSASYDAAILLDAAPRGEPPGTLYVIEPEIEGVEAPRRARDGPGQGARAGAALGGTPPRRSGRRLRAAERGHREVFSASRSAPRSTRPSAWWRRCWRS